MTTCLIPTEVGEDRASLNASHNNAYTFSHSRKDMDHSDRPYSSLPPENL